MMPGIALVGHARAGKDTVAQHLVREHGFTQIALADQVKHALLVLNPIIPATGEIHIRLQELVAQQGWEGAKEASPEIRRLMQTLGTDVARDLFGDEVWINLALRTTQPLLDHGCPVVISDIRFPNEARAFRQLGLFLVRVHRPGLTAQSGHASERSIDTISCDYELPNHTTLHDLHARIDAAVAAAESLAPASPTTGPTEEPQAVVRSP